MILQLPNLDDRSWADLVDQGRALVPLYAPDWTDHNVHDPGITMIELLASIAELDIYQLNRISDLQRRKFLALIGVVPRPPRAALGAAAFSLAGGAPVVRLPAGVELVESEAAEPQARVRTLDAIEILPFTLGAVLVDTGTGIVDATPHYSGRPGVTGEPPVAFRPGGPSSQALYLGFQVEGAPDVNARLTLYIAFEGPGAGPDARRRLLDEREDEQMACKRPPPRCGCAPHRLQLTPPSSSATSPTSPPAEVTFRHHSAVMIWEYWDASRNVWAPLDAADDTRSFTLDGTVVFTIPEGFSARTVGSVANALYYVRCRVVSGEHDAPPVLRAIAINAIQIEQANPVWQRWAIAPSATIEGTPPAPGLESGLRLQFGADGRLVVVAFDEKAPPFTVLEFEKSPGVEGLLTIEASGLGRASGTPHLRVSLRDRPIVTSTFRLVSFEDGGPRAWEQRMDLFASGRADAHLLLDPARGIVEFGDGEHGRVPPTSAPLLAAYHATLAEQGNLPAGASFMLDHSPRNRALLGDVGAIQKHLARTTSPVPAVDGEAAETLAHAIGRAIDAREASLRAVTLVDYETLALSTPGTRVARAAARAGVRPGFGCVKAAGHVVVVIVPPTGSPRSMPSQDLRLAVSHYLERRRVIGTRVEVIGPEYVEIAVKASVAAFPRINKDDVRTRAAAALDRFLHPLHGGADGTGWPFGRDVYRAELLEILDGTEGIDHVLSMELIVDGCGGHCGNVCLPPNGLVAAGRHQIDVV